MTRPTLSELAELALIAFVVLLLGLGLAACAYGDQTVQREPVEDRCESIERNFFYDGEGRLVFAQWIFRDTHSIVAWRLVKPEHRLHRTDSGWALDMADGSTLRRVESLSFYDTWTQEDVELLERDWLPAEERRGLRGEKQNNPGAVTPRSNQPVLQGERDG